MSSKSQSSFASRLGKAKTLQTILSSYTDYVAPTKNASVLILATTITSIENIQKQYNTAKSDYTTKTYERKKVFTENSDSLEKRLSPIRTFIEALKGKNSTELKQVSTAVNKIRGHIKKTSKILTNNESETSSISLIERTYASRLANFKNIIDIIASYGESYAPPNTLISVESLNELATEAEAKNNTVDVSLSVLKPIINKRQELFDQLHEQTQSIKNFVKAQYGLNSNEYKQIKGLVI